ncbi:hypothetical protein [Bacillus sp. ISL-57]|uniref:hypothetical protein n=1 Tax=Bacillus sp. ISL-57 TaxID=2819135 RepID=UPI001BEA6127|nr:hypothetical protein [Bacillus sp. ISL-57]
MKKFIDSGSNLYSMGIKINGSAPSQTTARQQSSESGTSHPMKRSRMAETSQA